ncbi:unnamed protein product [Tilletia controversa]|uniref:EF-hand domain-containing protein n=1 Tax=Tilletia controversa TaxID=13291 RepID=A0A8X7MNS3_9BASI|nr:hypothetical protein CF328_g6274 [Tilletia controversa]KAE8243254.1 hypothetical protein A4X06_0g6447 [Tilletia controversa]CAD6895811.1 unnamed protein product [Tilletia controversa]
MGSRLLVLRRSSSAASGDRVFDEEGNEHISVGELRSFLTSLGEKLENKEVDELLKTIPTLVEIALGPSVLHGG